MGLVDYLGQTGKLKKHHMELLMDESTTRVDLSRQAKGPIARDAMMDLVGLRCQVGEFFYMLVYFRKARSSVLVKSAYESP